MAGALDELPRAWMSISLPGHRDHPAGRHTYSTFAVDALPPVARALGDDLAWLAAEPPVEASVCVEQPGRATEATAANLTRLLGSHRVVLPRAFRRFIAERALQQRIRSTTDCYLDLGEFIVPTITGDGWLIHFLSDSQWVLHWLLYVDDTQEAVIASPTALGFDGDAERPVPRVFDPAQTEAAVCAPSFSEFIYRFWIENEIGFSLLGTPAPLTPEQQRYVAHFSPR